MGGKVPISPAKQAEVTCQLFALILLLRLFTTVGKQRNCALPPPTGVDQESNVYQVKSSQLNQSTEETATKKG